MNVVAPLNIELISVTAAVFHELISWLNAVAPLNIFVIFITAEVFHEFPLVAKGRLNVVAPLNI